MSDNARRTARAKFLVAKYRLTENDYNALLQRQGGGCAICQKKPEEGKHLHVDHDHITDAVRGLLCSGCNTGLGCFQDSTWALARAAAYLERNLSNEDEYPTL
jgi:hypothetical protein